MHKTRKNLSLASAYQWTNEGLQLFKQRKYQEAISYYNNALNIDPQYKIAWDNMGEAYFALGHYDQAIDCYERALVIDPNYKFSWYKKGKALLAVDQPGIALKCFDKTLALGQDYKYAWADKGCCHFLLQEYKEAVSAYKQALVIDPNYSYAQKELAEVDRKWTEQQVLLEEQAAQNRNSMRGTGRGGFESSSRGLGSIRGRGSLTGSEQNFIPSPKAEQPVFAPSHKQTKLPKDFENILERLKQNDPSLTKLDFRGYQIGVTGAKKLGWALEQNQTVKQLWLSGNQIGDDGIKHLKAALRKNTSLRWLHLNGNQITDLGVKELGWAIEQNQGLSALDLANNEISDAGVAALMHALTSNRLTNLYLQKNLISGEGGLAIYNFLQENYRLTSLGIEENKLSNREESAIKELCVANRNLRDELHHATQKGDLGKVKEAVKKGVNLLSETGEDYNTPLHWAVLGKDVNLTFYLMREMQLQGLTLDKENNQGKTAADLAQGTNLVFLLDGNYDAEAWLKKREFFLKQNDSKNAMLCCDHALLIDKKCKEAHLAKAQIALEQKNYLKAIECYDKFLKIAPDDKAVLKQKAAAANLFGIKFFQDKEYDQAAAYFDLAIEAHADEPQYQTNRGNVSYELKKYPESLKYYEQALKINPTHIDAKSRKAGALNELGVQCYATRSYAKAIEYFQKATTTNPTDKIIWNNLGNTYFELKQYDKASNCYQKSLKIDPNYEHAKKKNEECQARLQIEKEQGHKREEERKIQEKTELEAKQRREQAEKITVLYKKAVEIYNKNNYEDCIKCCDEILVIDASHKDALNVKKMALSNKGWKLHANKEEDQAILYFDQALKIDADYDHAWNGKACTLKELKQFDAALDCFGSALKSNPKEKTYWFNKGLTHFDKDDYQQALQCYESSLEQDYSYKLARTEKERAEKCLRNVDLGEPAKRFPPAGVSEEAARKKSLYEEGWRFYQLHTPYFYKEAIKYFDEILKTDKNYLPALNGKAIALQALKKYDEAIEYLEKAIKIAPNDKVIWRNKGRVFSDKEDFTEAVKCFEKLLEIDPNYQEAKEGKARAIEKIEAKKAKIKELTDSADKCYKESNYDESLKYYDRILSIDPIHILALNGKGLIYFSLKQYPSAAIFFGRVLAISSKDKVVWCNKGHAHFENKEYAEAIKCYEKGLELDPHYARAQNELANADKFFQEFLEQNSQTKDFCAIGNNLCRHYSTPYFYKKAIYYFDKALAINQNHKEAWKGKGLAFKALNKIDEAIECFNKILEFEPNDIIVLYDKGFALLDKGLSDEAAICFDQILEIDPRYSPKHKNTFAKVLYEYALKLYNNHTHYDKAMRYVTHALLIEPQSTWALNLKGLIFSAKKEYQKAIDCYDEALKINRSDKVVWYNKGNAFFTDGDYANAIKFYEESLKIDSSYKDAKDQKEKTEKLYKEYQNTEVGYFFAAISQGDEAKVKKFLKFNNFLVNTQNAQGRLPLYVAAQKGHKTIVELLLSQSAQLEGSLALHAAALNNHADIIKLLYKRQWNRSKELDESGLTVLQRLALANNVAMAELILNQEKLAENFTATLEAKNSEGKTALHIAVESGSFDMVKFLLAQGANKEATDNYAWTPLHTAAAKATAATAEIIEELLKAQANQEALAKSREGVAGLFSFVVSAKYTPLHLAALNSNEQALAALLAHGANRDAMVDGKTAAKIVREGKNPDLIKLFETKQHHHHEQSSAGEPFSLPQWLDKAKELYKQEKYLEAIECCNNALKIDEKHAEVLAAKKLILYKQGIKLFQVDKQYQAAIDYFDRALTIDAGFASAWNAKGLAFEELREYAEAILCYEKAVEFNSSYKLYWYNKGRCHNANHEYPEALECYEKALIIDPEYQLAKDAKVLVLEKSQPSFDQLIEDNVDSSDSQIILERLSANLASEEKEQDRLALIITELQHKIAENKTNKEKITSLETELKKQKTNQQVLLANYAVKKDKKIAIERFRQEPNLWQFYHRMLVKLEEVMVSVKAAAGGYVQGTEGDLANVKKGVELLGEVVSLAPLVGNTIDGIIKLSVGKVLDYVDEERQNNTIKTISNLMSLSETQKLMHNVARQLTESYEEQLRQLKKLDENQELGLFEKAKEKILKEKSDSDAEVLAEFAVAWMVEGLEELDKTKPLDQQLVTIVLRQKAELEGFIEKAKQKLSDKFGMNQVQTIKGESWSYRDFFARPGIKTKEGVYYNGSGTDPEKYGYCIASQADAEAKGLTEQKKAKPKKVDLSQKQPVKSKAPLFPEDLFSDPLSAIPSPKSPKSSVPNSDSDEIRRMREELARLKQEKEHEKAELYEKLRHREEEHEKLKRKVGEVAQRQTLFSGGSEDINMARSSGSHVFAQVRQSITTSRFGLPEHETQTTLAQHDEHIRNLATKIAEVEENLTASQRFSGKTNQSSKNNLEDFELKLSLIVNHSIDTALASFGKRNNIANPKITLERYNILRNIILQKLRPHQNSLDNSENLTQKLSETLELFFKKPASMKFWETRDHNVTMLMDTNQMFVDIGLHAGLNSAISELSIRSINN